MNCMDQSRSPSFTYTITAKRNDLNVDEPYSQTVLDDIKARRYSIVTRSARDRTSQSEMFSSIQAQMLLDLRYIGLLEEKDLIIVTHDNRVVAKHNVVSVIPNSDGIVVLLTGSDD